jgi:hypothetical protein
MITRNDLKRMGINPDNNFEVTWREISCTETGRAIRNYLGQIGIDSRMIFLGCHAYIVPKGARPSSMPYNRFRDSTGSRYLYKDPNIRSLLREGRDITKDYG